MNFLRFPFLVQQKILQNFSITEKVLLSFCSTKSAQVIRNLRLNIKRLLYSFGRANPFILMPSLTIRILDKNDREEDVLVFVRHPCPQLPDHETMLLPIGGMNILLRYRKTTSVKRRPQLYYLKPSEDRLITRIQDHMNFIFPRLNYRRLVIKSYNDQKFEKFKNLNEICLECDDVPAEKLEKLKMDHPELKCLRVESNWEKFLKNHNLSFTVV